MSQGVPEKDEVLQGLGLGLDAKAIAAVRQWAFRPAVANDGIPIRSALTAAVRFLLGASPSWRITRAAYTVQMPPGRRPPRPKSKPILARYAPPPAGVCADTKKIAELQLSIDAEGVPHRVVSSDIADDSPALRAVIEAAEGWRYTPALLDGAPALSDAFLELECDPAPVPVTHSSVTIQAGKDIPMPAVVSAAQPDYTEEAYSAKVEGHAQIAVTIDITGRVTNVASHS